MKKSTIEKIEKEISEKTKLPNEIKEKIKKEVFTNIVIASIIILYFILIVLGSVNSIKRVRTTDLNIFSLLFLGGAIFLFEIAYKKDDGKLAIHGIESLIIAIFTLFLPYIIFELNEINRKYYFMAGIYIGIYYILKSITIYVIEKNKYINNNVSDVKEIVKKEKTKRRIKENIEESEFKDKNNKNNIGVAPQGDLQKEQPKNSNQKQETTPKKRGRPKKTETTNKENKNNVGVAPQGDPQKEQSRDENQIKENTPKKRGRPKKTEISNNQNKKNVGVALQGDPQPKKRGRPRKVAVNND